MSIEWVNLSHQEKPCANTTDYFSEATHRPHTAVNDWPLVHFIFDSSSVRGCGLVDQSLRVWGSCYHS